MAKVGYIFKANSYDALDADKEWMRQYGCVQVVEEECAHEALRPQWKQLMASLGRGDELVVAKFSNAVRDLRGLAALVELRRIKGKDLTTFSVVFDSLGQIADYCRVDNAQFRLLKQNLPGPFTFLLDASSRMPHKALERRRTIGIRIPDNLIPRAIVERLGAPLLTSSVLDDEETEYMTDPELIHERYGRDVELVIDGGAGDAVPTTVVDLTGGEPEILREGKGVLRE